MLPAGIGFRRHYGAASEENNHAAEWRGRTFQGQRLKQEKSACGVLMRSHPSASATSLLPIYVALTDRFVGSRFWVLGCWKSEELTTSRGGSANGHRPTEN
jgi:hypothetical protein